MERRVNQREEHLDKKADNLEAREESLNDKYKDAEQHGGPRLSELHDQQHARTGTHRRT